VVPLVHIIPVPVVTMRVHECLTVPQMSRVPRVPIVLLVPMVPI